MRHQHALAMLAVLVASSASAATIEYCEIFPNPYTTLNAAQSTVGWQIQTNGVTDGDDVNSRGVSNAMGRPIDAVPVNSGATATDDNGLMGCWSVSSARNLLFFTGEHAFDIGATPIDTVSWYQGNNNSGNGARVTLRVAGTWYASNASLTAPAISSASAFGGNATLLQMSVPEASWRFMNADGTVGETATLPTSGTVDGFGLLFNATGTIRFDTYTISVVPEPTLVGLPLAGAMLLASRRRRS